MADNPGRHEPGTGEINCAFLFQELERLGYGGWIGCEYVPTKGTSSGLTWARAWMRSRDQGSRRSFNVGGAQSEAGPTARRAPCPSARLLQSDVALRMYRRGGLHLVERQGGLCKRQPLPAFGGRRSPVRPWPGQ
ncbi:hypothetical protein [Rhizobium sp. NZLR3b]|uniref:hypothetical protein n=1 Tax=Rhizobium sp. NZLR3b TaxID=2731101 RepID=UPI00287F50A3|nr:hypothetical protein [Rhizobium sp. NZLR3b]